MKPDLLLRIRMPGPRRSSFGVSILGLVLCCGCMPRTIDLSAQTAAIPDQRMDYTDWGAVLSQACAGDSVSYDRLQDDPRPLDRFLARVAKVGPRSVPGEFPTKSHKLAYAINCYNATLLRSILGLAKRGRLPATLPGDLESRFQFRIDGQLMTPGSLRRMALELAGDDWRVRLALHNGHRVGPSLSRRAFLADLMDGQLSELVRASVANPNMVLVVHDDRQELQLWIGLYECREQIVEAYKARTGAVDATLLGALIDLADRARREELNTAIGYGVASIPDAGQINAVVPPIPEEEQSVFSRLANFSLIQPTK